MHLGAHCITASLRALACVAATRTNNIVLTCGSAAAQLVKDVSVHACQHAAAWTAVLVWITCDCPCRAAQQQKLRFYFLNAGDEFLGTLWDELYKGQATAQLQRTVDSVRPNVQVLGK
jgi:hypothetical protein